MLSSAMEGGWGAMVVPSEPGVFDSISSYFPAHKCPCQVPLKQGVWLGGASGCLGGKERGRPRGGVVFFRGALPLSQDWLFLSQMWLQRGLGQGDRAGNVADGPDLQKTQAV